ncbi:hypothetical protein [Reyranella sp.]|uniref:hypothetical protein n=1 Tax=Reyranella sp. TaxID=1929291 RepID=UPI0037852F3C
MAFVGFFSGTLANFQPRDESVIETVRNHSISASPQNRRAARKERPVLADGPYARDYSKLSIKQRPS